MVDCRACRSVLACLAVALLFAVPAIAARGPVADLSVGGASLDWTPIGSHPSMKLTVSGPGDLLIEQTFAGAEAPSLSIFDKVGQRLPDGQYRWELRAAASTVAKRQLEGGGDQGQGAQGGVQSGSFAIANGAFVADEGQREAAPRALARARINAPDQVIPDDLIVQGSACVGLDCVNNESFGFDTIRLKENNTRIKFEDTSVGTFPTNDWQLTANDSASGASSKFSIEDITGSKVPFTITAGAATNSIFADSTGRIGLRTSTPVLDLHINTSNTPAIRLEQNNSGGFTAQTWDIGANEANWFVRDVTGGSKLSLRIRPGAPTSSVDISADGDVGIGTGSPSEKLHVLGSDGSNKLLVEETNGTATAREMAEYRNNGDVVMIFKNSGSTDRWSIGTTGTDFFWNNQGSANTEMQLNGASGNLLIEGTLTQGSSRTIKTAIAPVDAKDVLSRVAALPLAEWQYKTDLGVRHLGPMAEDFRQAFGLGADDQHLAPGDAAGVALVAIQGLQQELTAKDQEIATLKQRLQALEAAVAAIAPH